MNPVDRIASNPVKTRQDLTELTKALLDPLLPGFSPGGARVKIGASGAIFDAVAAEFEGFARPLWGIAPLLAGGGSYDGVHHWEDGFRSGPNPLSPTTEFWGKPAEKDQRFVEMASLGYSLALAPDVFWKPLEQRQRDNLNDWLLEINTNVLPDNNWRFFRIVVNLGLKMAGGRYSQDIIDEELEYTEKFYQDGWPTDGLRPEIQQTDYYATSFAIPFYSMVYSKLAGESDPERAELYKARARNMATSVVHLFAPDGSAIPFGRSLTYRFAMAAFWAAVAFAEIELPAPLSWGVVKGLLLRNIRWFSQQSSNFMSDGIITVGYNYPQQYMAEQYNSPQSPYWCLKSFLILALPDSHPFWAAEEQPYPASLLRDNHIFTPAQQVCTHAAGHTYLLSSGQEVKFQMNGGAQKYGKFAYSSAFGFSVPVGDDGLYQHAIDSMIGLCDDENGERWRVRRKPENVEIDVNGVITSSWKPWPDVIVKTWLFPPSHSESGYHVRVHHITTGRDLKTAEGSFAVKDQQGPVGLLRWLQPSNLGDLSAGGAGKHEEAGVALAVSMAGAVGIRDLTGDGLRRGVIQLAAPNSNLISSRTVIPTLTRDLKAGTEVWLAAGVFAVPFEDGLGSRAWSKAWSEELRIPNNIGFPNL